MEKTKCKDYWEKKDLVLGLTSDKKIVSIGEVLDDNTERYLHINVNDFLKFAEMVAKTVKDDNH